MSASSSRSTGHLWPFALRWLKKKTVPDEIFPRQFEEYIASIAMLQINQQRQGVSLPPLVFATITDNLHQSPSDPNPHITIAAATAEMQKSKQHIVVHSRTDVLDHKTALFLGGIDFPDRIKDDRDDLRQSYKRPLAIRNSLAPQEAGTCPVGCFYDDLTNTRQWFFLGANGEPSYIDKFFKVGTGKSEYLAFWNPEVGASCRAVFLGQERPDPYSPDPQPNNLEGGMESLALNPGSSPNETVIPYLKWGKDSKKLIRFTSSDGKERRTGWQDWLLFEGGFLCQHISKHKNFWAGSLPGEWVQLEIKASSDRPYRFKNAAGKAFKTKPKAWNAGEDGTYYACIQEKRAYLVIGWDNELQEAGEQEDKERDDGGQSDAEGTSDDSGIDEERKEEQGPG